MVDGFAFCGKRVHNFRVDDKLSRIATLSFHPWLLKRGCRPLTDGRFTGLTYVDGGTVGSDTVTTPIKCYDGWV